MKNNVISPARPRILAIRVRDTIRIPAPSQTVIVPIPELPLFLLFAEAAKARHQRTARLAQVEAAQPSEVMA